MKSLRDNWAWILIPVVLVAIALAVVFVLLSEDPEGVFRYPI
ncbi:hypothetical protein OAO71_00290 [Planctomycetota bacterium]|jgi:hypothetical protein|nr:hypothetical protein [Planctomycetota bacterium]MDB4733823.1 hypothetical protein [Planctomycetota bacterium]MDC0585107.1 hypothetical protein [Planctomycetota bacterium]